MSHAQEPVRLTQQVLNFSIAYGKTAHGLSKDFRTTVDEAKETVNKWYADRSEVRRCPCGPVLQPGWRQACLPECWLKEGTGSA